MGAFLRDWLIVIVRVDMLTRHDRPPRLAVATLAAGVFALVLGALPLRSSQCGCREDGPPPCWTMRCVMDVADEK